MSVARKDLPGFMANSEPLVTYGTGVFSKEKS